MSIRTKLELLGAEWHELTARIKGHENALKEHLESDWLEVKDRYETAIAHFLERRSRVESQLDSGIVTQLKNGASVANAVEAHLNLPQVVPADK